MKTDKRHPQSKVETSSSQIVPCYHCGEVCPDLSFQHETHYFCCQGCLSVFVLLKENKLDQYYKLNPNAGNNLRTTFRKNHFAYLDNEKVIQRLLKYQDGNEAHVVFHIPKIHCSSCIYLLEHLPQLLAGVFRVDIQFLKREARIIFDIEKLSLRNIVEFLVSLGYEPHLSLQDFEKKEVKKDKSLIYKLGVAGFAFGNILLLSFPEYLSSNVGAEAFIGPMFKYIAFALSLPVFFYSATEFFSSAYKGLKHKHLNIDFGVALAIILTFGRSLYEVFVLGQGGYFDSMAGIVFWMLVGRVLQQKTYDHISFKRSYTDYFPISATKIVNGKEIPTTLPDLNEGDVLLIHNQELIPADGYVLDGDALIDYSFVTGESVPVKKDKNELLYAGGKQLGQNLKIRLSKKVETSYLTSLWSDSKIDKDDEKLVRNSFIQVLAKYFTVIVLIISALAAIFWFAQGVETKAWRALTSVLIVACPCALLLTATFTDGYFIRILSKNGFFLRKANLVEYMAKVKHVVFDKTGTLTSAEQMEAVFIGDNLNKDDICSILSLARPSTHTFVKPISRLYDKETFSLKPVSNFKEHPGLGIEGWIDGVHWKAGLLGFFDVDRNENIPNKGTAIFIAKDGKLLGYYLLKQGLRKGVKEVFHSFEEKDYTLALLTGDYDVEKNYLKQTIGEKVDMRFEQLPQDKLNYVASIQEEGKLVAMVGDGLNDAGALLKSDIGICIVENMENFSPAGDAIFDAKNLNLLPNIFQFTQKHKTVIHWAFIFSIIYNLVGIYFAVQGVLSPLIAAILMPLSTFSIILITYSGSKRHAQKNKLKH